MSQDDYERSIRIAKLYRDMVLSVITEAMKNYASGGVNLIIEHNKTAPPGKYASKCSFLSTLRSIAEVTEGAINDVSADLIVDLQRAREED